jgi:putative hydrolase of the HAD superfamily
MFDLIYSSDIPRKYEMGAISSDKFYESVCSLSGISVSKDDFIDAFNTMFSPVPGMSDLVKGLKGNYRLGLLSNTNEWHFEYTISRATVFELFESVTLSYRVGEMKPGARIYLDALSKLRLAPERCVYIDDVKEYAVAASDLGMKGIHFISRESLIASLKGLGVKVDD